MPVLNETWSLIEVTDKVLADNPDTILEIIIPVHPKKTLAESKEAIEDLIEKYGEAMVKPVEQELPFIGGALIKGFQEAKGEFLQLLASDLETDPYLVKTMIEKAQAGEADIVTASRWLEGGSFNNYHPIKKICNKLFQSFFSLLYGVKLTDMTYGFRILKKELVDSIEWQELRHPIFFETLLKPIKSGYKVIEVPASWKAREEGESQIALKDYLDYFILGLKLRF